MTSRTYNTGPYDSDFDDPMFDAPGTPTADEQTWGMIAHLSAFLTFVLPSFGQIVGPLLVWLYKRDESSFVADQAKEALNFQITCTIAAVVFGFLSIVLIGIPFLIALGIGWLVLTIAAASKANRGLRYRYPLTVRFVK